MLITANRVVDSFQHGGFAVRVAASRGEDGAAEWTRTVVDSPVVCFESAPSDEHGFHTAAVMTETNGAFPPNTLFALKRVEEPGQWEAPNGVFPQQRLLVVTATYRAAGGSSCILLTTNY